MLEWKVNNSRKPQGCRPHAHSFRKDQRHNGQIIFKRVSMKIKDRKDLIEDLWNKGGVDMVRSHTNKTERKICTPTVYTRRVPDQRAVERDEIPYPYKVHDATLRPLLNIMDSASHNPALCATGCTLSEYYGLTRISLFAPAAGAIAACILNSKKQTRRNLNNINPKNTKKITDSWEYECEDNLRFWWWTLSNCGRPARKGHIREDSFAYVSYSSKDNTVLSVSHQYQK